MIQVINNDSHELKFQHIYDVCQIKLPKDRTKKIRDRIYMHNRSFIGKLQ